MSNAPGRDWRTTLRLQRDQLHADVARLADLRAVSSRRPRLDLLLGDLDLQLERITRAAVITLVGATGAGKSALLNALAGRPIATEGIDRPTTQNPVIYAPRDADLSELVRGCETNVSSAGGKEVGTPTIVRSVPTASPWTNHVLVDAPDVNSVAAGHREIVTALAERSDVLVVVLHRQSVVEEAPVSFLDRFARRRALLFVLNRTDELTADATGALLSQVRELAAARWQAPHAPVLALSALRAQTQPTAEPWVAFHETLSHMLRDNALAGVRRHNALGTASLIGELFAEIAADVRSDLEALASEVATGMDGLAQRIAKESAERWALRRADLNSVLWAEAAKRWDGPGGWALRAGGLASLGLGTGAFLARRHPLLAAGAAAGSVAAGQVQRAAEQRRVADVDGLLPPPSELARWYADTLSTARVRAARLTGDPEKLGLPSPDGVYGAATSAMEEAWRNLVDRELPGAAQRSLLRFLRPGLDLPVYGLAAWMVYRVATGFFAGDYVGVDFLVNAALLAAAYLFAVGFAVRRGLGLRARHLLNAAILRSGNAFGAWLKEVSVDVEKRATGKIQTLEGLSHLEKRWLARLGTATEREG